MFAVGPAPHGSSPNIRNKKLSWIIIPEMSSAAALGLHLPLAQFSIGPRIHLIRGGGEPPPRSVRQVA